jgi:hypothetical protein
VALCLCGPNSIEYGSVVAEHCTTKDQILRESFTSEDGQIEAMTIDDVDVRTFGDTAVATRNGTWPGCGVARDRGRSVT